MIERMYIWGPIMVEIFKSAIKRIKWLVAYKIAMPIYSSHLKKQALVYQYKRKFNIPTLIETGTFLGEMISAMHPIFKTIHSIELDEKLAKEAQSHFAKLKHIRIWHGDSSFLLPKIISQASDAVIFWLDGHYSEGITAKGELTTPIMAELQHISHFKYLEKSVILIDDARLFDGTNDYPKLQELEKTCTSLFLGHTWKVSDDIIQIFPK